MQERIPQSLLILYNRLSAMISNKEYKYDQYLELQIKDQF